MDAHAFANQLAEPSRSWAIATLERFPHLLEHCRAETADGVEGLHLRLKIPSHAGHDRNIVLWVDRGELPSLGFGPWHTHGEHCREIRDGEFEDESLLDLLGAILANEFVIVATRQFEDVLDLRCKDAIPVYRAGTPGTAGPLEIRTFSGAGDRVVPGP